MTTRRAHGYATPATLLDRCPRCGAETGERCVDLRRAPEWRRPALTYHPERELLHRKAAR